MCTHNLACRAICNAHTHVDTSYVCDHKRFSFRICNMSRCAFASEFKNLPSYLYTTWHVMLSAICTRQCLRSQATRAPILDGSSRLHSGTRAQFIGTSAPHARTTQIARPTNCCALAVNWLAADVVRRVRFCVGVQAAGQFRVHRVRDSMCHDMSGQSENVGHRIFAIISLYICATRT